MSNRTVLVFVGQTGTGKSACCNGAAQCLGNQAYQFLESDGTDSETRAAKTMTQGNFIIVDTPGLMDSEGVTQDDENINTIVRRLRELEYLNGVVLVLNWAQCRFDDPMQNALKLISDSFGKDSLHHLFVMFTYCAVRDEVALKQRTENLRKTINRRCGTELGFLTSFAVDNHPERGIGSLLPPDVLERLRGETRKQYADLMRVVSAKPMFRTVTMKAAEYEHVKKLKAADNALKQAIADKEAAEWLAEKEKEKYEEKERQRKIGIAEKMIKGGAALCGDGLGLIGGPGGAALGAGIGAGVGEGIVGLMHQLFD